MNDRKVPKSVSPDDIITKDVMLNLIVNRHLPVEEYLQEMLDIEINTYSAVVAVVKCDEF